jgi:hypothetical protein
MGQKISRESFEVSDESQKKKTSRLPPDPCIPTVPYREDTSPFSGQRWAGGPQEPRVQTYLSVTADNSEHFSISSFSTYRKKDPWGLI